ncbi:MAG TPA: cytochrome c oxidase accessory protein CcoG [Pararhizobium sp.]|uniref:cytochrome c oxidase accessory protein CcoG n=1 Tax=Pararhizobium sp. TaxID=1977563 RepID=UPI002BDB07EC|nr:cytochrome c oxidase accessory protein CcoG [Pararhizobium sp.]HTO30566.1 cytochrome c oxidase accessory protein CcoG [Pararhizobium sp.]
MDNRDVTRPDVVASNATANRQPLYARRKKIFPKQASGVFRRFKWIVMAITLGIYYLVPWIRWDRGPFAPDQAVLIDLSSRRFYFFFIEIWPQEFIYIAGLLVMAGIGLFLVTSTVGRAWCGYACPQTVWVDLFLVIERYFEGDRNAQMKLDAAPWSFAKIGIRFAKHVTWLVVAVLTGGAWIFYFADAPTLARDFVTGNAIPTAYATVAILTATSYIFGGLMREQVCTYMCPWPRIQAAMLDETSLTVTYNDWRGEPRTRHAKRVVASGASVGDCVDCNACVAVCPMGIDIRDGQQLECITCALCIDACDDVMGRLGKARGLISYSTLNDYNANMAVATAGGTSEVSPELVRNADGFFSDTLAHFHIRKLLRPRTFIYFGAWSAIGLAIVLALATRDRLEINVLHDRNPQFVRLSDGTIRNGYTVKLLNMVPQPRTVTLELGDELSDASMAVAGLGDAGVRKTEVTLEPDRLKTIRVFVKADPEALSSSGAKTFAFVVTDPSTGERAEYTATFNSPETAQ